MYIMYPESVLKDTGLDSRLCFEVATKNFTIGDTVVVDENFVVILVQNGRVLTTFKSFEEKNFKIDRKVPGLKTKFLSNKVENLRIIFIRNSIFELLAW